MNKRILLSKLDDQDRFILDFLCMFYLQNKGVKSKYIWKKLQEELQFHLSHRQLTCRLQKLEKLGLVFRAYLPQQLLALPGMVAAFWGMSDESFKLYQSISFDRE
jgi:hypothetical protein